MKIKMTLRNAAAAVLCFFSTAMANATVEGTLANMQNKLINTILPAVAILGLVFAGLSFAVGNENAKRHMAWAIMGTIIGFAAPSIIHFLQGVAQ